jgi:hypothetical protein
MMNFNVYSLEYSELNICKERLCNSVYSGAGYNLRNVAHITLGLVLYAEDYCLVLGFCSPQL